MVNLTKPQKKARFVALSVEWAGLHTIIRTTDDSETIRKAKTRQEEIDVDQERMLKNDPAVWDKYKDLEC
jgi:hypothetical protein